MQFLSHRAESARYRVGEAKLFSSEGLNFRPLLSVRGSVQVTFHQEVLSYGAAEIWVEGESVGVRASSKRVLCPDSFGSPEALEQKCRGLGLVQDMERGMGCLRTLWC